MFENTFTKQLVLVGGGHANVQVLKKLCMIKVKGLHTILISEHFDATYSGMTPGYIHKDFNKDDISIDLQKLSYNAGATFIKDKVVKLDTYKKKLELKKFPIINYDLLSINTGSISNTKEIEIRSKKNCIPVKPISLLVKKLNQIDKVIKSNKIKVAIIGGGIASYELAFSLSRRYNQNIEISIIGKNNLKEKNLNIRTKNNIRKFSKKIGIKQILGEVKTITENHLKLKNNVIIESNLILLSTGAAIEDWLLKSNLKSDKDGFITVDDNLLSINDKNIFVTGDVCNVKNMRRPKSGVIAVRQGEVLKENIFLKLAGKPLVKFRPQKNWLYLIGTYQNYALLNYFFLSFHARWCWKLKVIIDTNFMNKFKFKEKKLMNTKVLDLKNSINDEMYCQGCGSKVSKNNLLNFLKEEGKNSEFVDSVKINLSSKTFLQTIDHLKYFYSLNPYDFGRISYLHSQNDILAAGGKVNSLSVSIGVPFSKNLPEEYFLKYFMKGIKFESDKDQAVIASGHSYQSNEPGITVNMNGQLLNNISKNSAKKDDLIYLTKPLGTGYLLAAYYRNTNLISSDDLSNLLNYLKESNSNAAKIGQKYKTTVMTDISGFGLASHLSDICLSSKVSADINLNEKILINSNIKILKDYQSTGFLNNLNSVSSKIEISNNNLLSNILYDPQTNGPLMIVIQQDNKKNFEKDFLKSYKREPIFLGHFISKSKKLIRIT